VQAFIPDIVDYALAGEPRDAALSRLCADAASRLVGSDRDFDERWRLMELSIVVAHEAGDADDRLYAVGGKVELLLELGRFDDARTLLDTAIAAANNIGDDLRAESLEHWHVRVDMEAGDFVSAERRMRTILAALHRTTYISSAIGTYLGDCAFGRGDFRTAIGHWADFLSTMAPAQLVNVLLQIYAIAGACAELEEDEAAAELWAAAVNAYETRTGQPWSDLALTWLEEPLTESQGRLAPDVLEAARQRGALLGYESMIARTLEIAAEVTS
jgi:tetratricopeptide (TPR) repeat protein